MGRVTLTELVEIYERPLFELIDQSRKVYREHWKLYEQSER